MNALYGAAGASQMYCLEAQVHWGGPRGVSQRVAATCGLLLKQRDVVSRPATLHPKFGCETLLIRTKGDPTDRHAYLTGCEGAIGGDNICIAVPRSTCRTARSLSDVCCSSASARGLRTSATARPLTARICRSPPLRYFHAPSSPCPRVSSQAICDLRRHLVIQNGSKIDGVGYASERKSCSR